MKLEPVVSCLNIADIEWTQRKTAQLAKKKQKKENGDLSDF